MDPYLKWILISLIILGGIVILVGTILGYKKPRVKYRHWLPRQLLVTGITIWPWIMFDVEKRHIGLATFKHECIHLEQVRRMSWVPFYFMYLLWLVLLGFRYLFGILGSPYENHPYEKEAYKRQKEGLTTPEGKLFKNDIWP